MTVLITKLDAYGVRGKEKAWISNYLSDRKQRVVLGGATSSWSRVERGVPQGSILGPLLFTIFVNDLPSVIERCRVNLYADDTTIYFSSVDPQEVKEVLEAELGAVAQWITQNHLKMNVGKTQLMILSRRRRKHEAEQIHIHHEGIRLDSEEKVKYLGVEVDRILTWKDRVHKVRRNCLISLAKLSRVSPFLPLTTKKPLYNALVLPHLDYCSVVWMECGVVLRQKVERLQNFGMRLVTSSPRLTHSADLRNRLKWMTLEQRRQMSRLSTSVHSR